MPKSKEKEMKLTCIIERSSSSEIDAERFLNVMTNHTIFQGIASFLTYTDLMNLSKAFQGKLKLENYPGFQLVLSNHFYQIKLFPMSLLEGFNVGLYGLQFNPGNFQFRGVPLAGLGGVGAYSTEREFNIMHIMSHYQAAEAEMDRSGLDALSSMSGELSDHTIFHFETRFIPSWASSMRCTTTGVIIYAPDWPALINSLSYQQLRNLVQNINTHTEFSDFLKENVETAFSGPDSRARGEALSTVTASLTRAFAQAK